MNKKIDIIFRDSYICSTKSSKTCREAKQNYLEGLKVVESGNSTFTLSERSKAILANPSELKAFFDKSK